MRYKIIMNSWVVGIVGIAVGIGIGWFAGDRGGDSGGQVKKQRPSLSEAGGRESDAGAAEEGVGETQDEKKVKKIPSIADMDRIARKPIAHSEKLISIRQMLAGLPIESLQAIATEASSSPKWRANSHLIFMIIGDLWAEQDPEGLFKFSQSSVKPNWTRLTLMVLSLIHI